MRLGGGQSQGEKADFHRFWSIFAGKQPNLSVFAGFSGHQDTGIADNPEIFQKPYPGGRGWIFFYFLPRNWKAPGFLREQSYSSTGAKLRL
jgi:hypothetical protein